MTEPWQSNWDRFIDLLSEYLRAGGDLEGFNSRIAGKSIAWSGHIEEVQLDEIAPNVYIALSPRRVDLGGGNITILDGISLPIAEQSRGAWAGMSPGEAVQFKAVLGRHGSPFPTVSVKTFRSGETMVSVRLADGIPVG
jgi:hypothetical protein